LFFVEALCVQNLGDTVQKTFSNLGLNEGVGKMGVCQLKTVYNSKALRDKAEVTMNH